MIKIFHLLKVVDAYKSATGFTDSTISTYVFNAGKQVERLRTGRDITVSRFNDALRWFSKNWPEDAVWPDGISRPSCGGVGDCVDCGGSDADGVSGGGGAGGSDADGAGGGVCGGDMSEEF